MRSNSWIRSGLILRPLPRISILKHRESFLLRRFAASAGPDDEPSRGQAKDGIRWNRIARHHIPVATLALGTSLAYHWYTRAEDDKTLNPHDFVSYTLISKEPVSSTSSIFTLRSLNCDANSKICAEAWRRGIWSVQMKQPQLQIARSYTPLPPLGSGDGFGDADLRFLIRRDPNGEVSGYLHKLPLGATIDLRGPRIEFDIPEEVGEVLFLAGGTGIAPALQMVHTLLERRKPSENPPRIRILWANRRSEDALDQPAEEPKVESSWLFWKTKSISPEPQDPVTSSYAMSSLSKELAQLKARHAVGVEVQYLVDEQKTFIDERILARSLAKSDQDLGQ